MQDGHRSSTCNSRRVRRIQYLIMACGACARAKARRKAVLAKRRAAVIAKREEAIAKAAAAQQKIKIQQEAPKTSAE